MTGTGSQKIVASETERLPISIGQLLVAFDQMAFRDQGKVTKWRAARTIRLSTNSVLPAEYIAVIQGTLKDLASLSGLVFQVVDDPQSRPADITLTIISGDLRPEFGKRLYVEGFTNIFWLTQDGIIRRAEVTIRREAIENKIAEFSRIFRHEMLHAIGLPEHAHGFDSISSYRPKRETYSDWDRIFVSMLYTNEIVPGMSRLDGLLAACEQLTTLKNISYASPEPGVSQTNCDSLTGKVTSRGL